MNIIQREYEILRDQRVRLRKGIEHYSKRSFYEPQNRYGVDGHLNSVAGLQAQLRSTEKRWTELHLLLRKPLPAGPVKLAVTSRTRPVQLRSAEPRSAAPGYLTRALFPR